MSLTKLEIFTCGAARMRPKRSWHPKTNLLRVLLVLIQFPTVRNQMEGTVGLKTTSVTGPSRTKFLAVLLIFTREDFYENSIKAVNETNTFVIERTSKAN